MNTEVIHNQELQRYEINLDGAKVGHADYKVDGDVLVFDHTEVDPAVPVRLWRAQWRPSLPSNPSKMSAPVV